MSLKYGLNIKGAKVAPPPRKTILDDDDEAEEDDTNNASPKPAPSHPNGVPPCLASKPPTRKLAPNAEHGVDLSSLGAANARMKAAEQVDANIFDYDSFHDAKSSVTEAKKAAARQEAIERKPKYINNLLDAAARRKQDQTIAKEKLLQKAREAEGDEFADKEKFVTGAYKQQQEEARRLEEEEKRKEEEEDRRKRVMGGGMQGFYRTIMDQTEQQHREAMDAAENISKEPKETSRKGSIVHEAFSEAETPASLRAKGIHLNEDGQIIDKRELLTAGLNVSAQPGDARNANHLRTSKVSRSQPGFLRNTAARDAQRERQSRMMEEQLAEKAKRAREEEEEERARMESAAKTRKTDADKMDAKARFLARKAAKERGGG